MFSTKNDGHQNEHDHDHDHNHETLGSPNEMHTVTVKEVLPTEKYVYLYVSEKEKEFWIAASKMEVAVGETYFYRGGLLKTNFQSKEYNRTFDRMYLVSKLVPANHAQEEQPQSEEAEAPVEIPPADVAVEGSIRIAELVANPEKYAGKEIQISGVCTKVNANIMGRNWLHLRDGSQDDYDLVVTSATAVPQGHTITMKGIVATNKDFGAGYEYAILVEEGVLVR